MFAKKIQRNNPSHEKKNELSSIIMFLLHVPIYRTINKALLRSLICNFSKNIRVTLSSKRKLLKNVIQQLLLIFNVSEIIWHLLYFE